MTVHNPPAALVRCQNAAVIGGWKFESRSESSFTLGADLLEVEGFQFHARQRELIAHASWTRSPATSRFVLHFASITRMPRDLEPLDRLDWLIMPADSEVLRMRMTDLLRFLEQPHVLRDLPPRTIR